MLKKPSLLCSSLPLIFMFGLISCGNLVFKIPLSFLLIVSAIFTGLLAKGLGLTWNEMLEGIANKIKQTSQGLLLVLCIGGLISSWMISGTIPMFIYYGIQLIDPQYFFVTAFLVTALASTVTGTSFGSAGTIGVAVMGIAIAQGLSLPITAGAVISGAIFGDKMSPCSDTTILASISTNTDLYKHIGHMMYTTGGATIVSLAVYAAAGFFMSSLPQLEASAALIADLEALYTMNWLLMLPPILVLAGSLLKKPTIPVILAASFLALILGITMQGFSFPVAANAFIKGFSMSSITPAVPLNNTALLTKLLNRGGISSMLEVLLLMFCVFAFAGIYSRAGFLNVLLTHMLKLITSVPMLIITTLFSSLLVCFATGSTYLSILMLGELFSPIYERMNVASQNLSRTLEDAGTCAVPIIPWSITGIYLSTTVGVATLDYLPWAVLCYSGMIFAIVFAVLDFRITRRENREE